MVLPAGLDQMKNSGKGTTLQSAHTKRSSLENLGDQGPFFEIKVTKNGVTWHGLRYYSSELSGLVGKIGTLQFDASAPGHIYFVEGDRVVELERVG
ncbi:hypothetical protein GHO34_06815 [Pseudomonas sp. FSL R10-2245]|nr:hypothetical protein [Pseudomonas sp. FSL R10-2245]